MRRRFVALLAAAGVLSGTAVAVTGPAEAAPYERFLKSFRCDSPDPWPGAPLVIEVDATWTKFPSDGLPGPGIDLASNNLRGPGILPNLFEYNSEVTVSWRNHATGKRGTSHTRSRGHRVNWGAVIRPGSGRVTLRVDQRIGANAFVPMVNPQQSTCTTVLNV